VSAYNVLEIYYSDDVNVFETEDEEILKYQPLARKVSTCYGQPVEIAPTVFGHTNDIYRRQLTI